MFEYSLISVIHFLLLQNWSYFYFLFIGLIILLGTFILIFMYVMEKIFIIEWKIKKHLNICYNFSDCHMVYHVLASMTAYPHVFSFWSTPIPIPNFAMLSTVRFFIQSFYPIPILPYPSHRWLPISTQLKRQEAYLGQIYMSFPYFNLIF